MYHIDNATSVTNKPAKSSVTNSARSYATAGSAQNNTTVLSADFINTITDELLNVVEAGNQIPHKSLDNQLLSAIKTLISQSSKGIITNGSFVVDQRRNGQPETLINNKYSWASDRQLVFKNSANTMEVRRQQWLGTNNTSFDYCGEIKAVTGYNASTGSAQDYLTGFCYILEKADLESLYDKPLTVSFNFRASSVGKYSAGFFLKDNIGKSISYVSDFTMNAVGTDQKIEITLPKIQKTSGNTLGLTDRSLHIFIGGLGSTTNDHVITPAQANTLIESPVGQWKVSISDSVNWAVNANGYIQMTGLQVDIGTSASDYRFEDYFDTLQQCQRYYEKIVQVKFQGYNPKASGGKHTILFKTTKRIDDPVIDGNVTNHSLGTTGGMTQGVTDLGANSQAIIVDSDSTGMTIRTTKAGADHDYDMTIDEIEVSADLVHSNY